MTRKAWLTILGALLALALLVAGYQGIKEKGRLEVLLQQADSTHHADSLTSLAEHVEHLAAVAKSDALRRLARAEVKKDSVQQVHTDSIVRQSANERDGARAVLADSIANVGRLRAALASVVRQSVQDSSGFAAERLQWDRTRSALLTTVHADSTAIAKGVAAENAALARAVASESQVRLLRQQQSSMVGSGLRMALWAAGGFALGRLTK